MYVAVVALLREKGKEKHHQVRLDKGRKGDQVVAAGAHRVVAGEPNTVEVTTISGEGLEAIRGEREGKERGMGEECEIGRAHV